MAHTIKYICLLSTVPGVIESNHPGQGLPENYAPLLVENIEHGGFTHIFAGHSAFGKNLMPRVAALLDTQQLSDIIAIKGEDSTFIKLATSSNLLNSILGSFRPPHLRR